MPTLGKRQSLAAGHGGRSRSSASGCASCARPHLDFLALAAPLLEGFGVGESANVVSHILIDVRETLRARLPLYTAA